MLVAAIRDALADESAEPAASPVLRPFSTILQTAAV
jgi:hypothetical protein